MVVVGLVVLRVVVLLVVVLLVVVLVVDVVVVELVVVDVVVVVPESDILHKLFSLPHICTKSKLSADHFQSQSTGVKIF